MDTEPRVEHNADAQQYEVFVGDERVGLAAYRDWGEQIVFTHTEVDPARQGQGLAAILVRHALDDVKSQGKRIVPACSYVDLYVRKHADDYAGIVDRST